MPRNSDSEDKEETEISQRTFEDQVDPGPCGQPLNLEKFLTERTLTSVYTADSDTASQSSVSFQVEDSHHETEYELVSAEERDPVSLSPACLSLASTGSKRLEWDSAGDVGYIGEASNVVSLTPIERLALGSVTQAYSVNTKLKRRTTKTQALTDSSTDEETAKPARKESVHLEVDYFCESGLASCVLNRFKKSNEGLPKASSLVELRMKGTGELQRSQSVGGNGRKGHIDLFLQKQGGSSSGSNVTLQLAGSPKLVSSETNSDRDSVKTQVTVVQENKLPEPQQERQSTSSDVGASTSTSSENDVQRRRRRKLKRSGDQALHDRTKSFEYLPGHVYESGNGSRQSLSGSNDSHRAQTEVQNLANQLANSDLIDALVIALKQRLDLERQPPLPIVPEPQPSCSTAPDIPPRNCTLTRPEPQEIPDDRGSIDTFETARYRHMDMATSSFEYRKVRRSRRQPSDEHSLESSVREGEQIANRAQEGYSSGSVFSGGRGSSSLPSYTPTSRHSDVTGDIDQHQNSRGDSLVSEVEVRSQLQVCKQLSRHLKGLREYVGQLERTWRALAPPEALTSHSASPVSHAEHQVSYSTPSTLSQSVTISIAPTPQSEDTTVSNVLAHPPPKLVREYASVSIDCHLDRVRARKPSVPRHTVVHRGVGAGSIRSVFARHSEASSRRGAPQANNNKVSVGVNTNDPVAKRRDFCQNYPSPIMSEPEREGLASVGVQTTPVRSPSLKSSRKSVSPRAVPAQTSPKRQQLPSEAFFFPLNRNSVIKLRGDSIAARRSSSISASSSGRTSSRNRRDEKKVPTLQESLQKRRPDFICRSEHRQQILHQAQEIRETKSVRRRERLASMASTLGSLDSEHAPGYPKLLAVPKTKMVPLSPIGSQQRMFTHKEMRQQTEKMFRRLPEAQQQGLDKAKAEANKANRLMAQIYQKKLQERALKGRVTLTHDQSILTG